MGTVHRSGRWRLDMASGWYSAQEMVEGEVKRKGHRWPNRNFFLISRCGLSSEVDHLLVIKLFYGLPEWLGRTTLRMCELVNIGDAGQRKPPPQSFNIQCQPRRESAWYPLSYYCCQHTDNWNRPPGHWVILSHIFPMYVVCIAFWEKKKPINI